MMKTICAGIASAALVAAPLVPAAAQTVAVPTADNPFGIPDDIQILGKENPDTRTATAVVNGYVITGTDIDQRVALVTSASETEVSDQELERLRVQVLRNLIDETLKIQASQALEMPVSQGEVEQTYAQLATQNFGQEPEKMAEYLISIGSSPAALKRQIEGEIAWENLLRRNIMPFVNVSAEEVNDVLERLEEARGQDEYRVGEIYLSATQENRAAVLQNAQRIMEQLRQGGSFVAYARQFSEATTAVVGGDLGWIRLGQLPPALDAQLQQMQAGQLNGPIEIPGGFSIIYLINKRKVAMADPADALLSLKQIAISFAPDVTQEAAEAKVNQFADFVNNLRSCADAETARDVLGATVVSNDQIRAANLPEQLRAIILNMQIGQTTPPFGSPQEGVRVLMLCGRDDPEQIGGPNFDEIMDQIEQERINKRAQRYLRDLRNDAYIEYN
ncbi:peptidyl-prolyl cis-trans isomerase SurA [Erythrobacter litoralis]|jgi:peptidyl-prolyl cis-trans isomerase SurA|uniref:Parvulin-like PPIase n=2 Tax=Erythrobacter/Porphyrobacter group TaxID=2800788 RepID=A0A074N5A2_9SPHN|nr:peptidylprolyl isomerase [Erythrobacter litoralis]AOL23017.1 peptidyl-prolyl cis-trans isomerase SurA [Erythrobacter litoralis]KEO93117.1 peptidylprolyl isomerase [Erythrobacter litoralis]MEE4338444.1 peptidylprolyl isomerase [Erythrobacter sp.]